jgi:hypothetical protein
MLGLNPVALGKVTGMITFEDVDDKQSTATNVFTERKFRLYIKVLRRPET